MSSAAMLSSPVHLALLANSMGEFGAAILAGFIPGLATSEMATGVARPATSPFKLIGQMQGDQPVHAAYRAMASCGTLAISVLSFSALFEDEIPHSVLTSMACYHLTTCLFTMPSEFNVCRMFNISKHANPADQSLNFGRLLWLYVHSQPVFSLKITKKMLILTLAKKMQTGFAFHLVMGLAFVKFSSEH